MAILQSGQVNEALRRFGNLRGVISTELDETIAPVMNIEGLPWRQDGVQWSCGQSVGAAVGNPSTVSIQDDRPAGDRGILVIEQIVVTVASGFFRVGWGAGGLAGGSIAYTGELPVRGSNLADALSGLPFRAVGNSGIAGSRVVFEQTTQIQPAPLVPILLPIFAVVPPTFAFYVESGSTNVNLNAHFFGRYWRQVG